MVALVDALLASKVYESEASPHSDKAKATAKEIYTILS